MLLLSSGAAAFSTTKLDPRSRPSFKAAPSVSTKEKDSTSPAPVPRDTAAFGVSNTAAASMAPALYAEEEDDEELIGYGTALISCVISLALGFTLGYGT